MAYRRFVILDRDGTIIEERNYLSDPDEVSLLPGSIEGLRQMKECGMGLVVISNQSGIGRGYFSESDLMNVHSRMKALLSEAGVSIDGIYWCPHSPEERCNCRKPETGLLLCAAEDLGFKPDECVVIGDKACDIELGRRAGAVTILVRTGYGADTEREEKTPADFVADSLLEAAEYIKRLPAQGGIVENRL